MRLTPEALGALRIALGEYWQRDGRSGKLTRETRAELLGVSVATAGRILSGGGVDRVTLAHTFKNLDLVWDDGFCEYIPDRAERVEERPLSAPAPLAPATLALVSPVPAASNSVERGPKSLVRRRYALGASLLGLAVAVGLWSAAPGGRGERVEPWETAFNDAFDEGMARFHRADYPGAQVSLQRAIRLARDHDSAGRISSALRLAGDLAAEQGLLSEARDRYRDALSIRAVFEQDQTKPAIYEALGDVETRLGEYGNAKRSLLRSLDGYRSFDDGTGVAMASRDLGSLAFRTKDLQGAERWFQKSLAAVKGLSKPDIEADVRGRRALVFLKQGRVGEARETLRGCLAYWSAKKHPRWIAECDLRLGLVEAKRGDLASASALIVRSRDGFERVGDEAGTLEASEHLRRLGAGTKRGP